MMQAQFFSLHNPIQYEDILQDNLLCNRCHQIRWLIDKIHEAYIRKWFLGKSKLDFSKQDDSQVL